MKASWVSDRIQPVALAIGLVCAVLGMAAGQPLALDPSKLPAPAKKPVDFDRDVKPILEGRCFRCHGPERPKSGLRLDTRETAIKGGDNGVDIVPGQSAQSPLIYYVARVVEDMEMPPPGKGDPLTAEEVGLLRAWIDQGAKWSEIRPQTTLRFSVEPAVAWITVDGDKQQFREQWGRKEGWSGGVQEFQFQERSPEGVQLQAEGRALGNQDDYRLTLELRKPNLGFAQFGYEQYRKYYDDTGGFYEPFATNTIRLGKDLDVDVGHAWLDLGLTLPHWPRIVLGYEYQFKEGTKSTLAWSDVTALTPPSAGLEAAALFPNAKDLDENTHILKLDLSHEIRGVRLDDSFRAEFYGLDSRRVESFPVTVGGTPAGGLRYHEEYDHVQAVNALRLEKQLRDWLLLGGGYLYSKLEGDGGFSVEMIQPAVATPYGPPIDASNPIVLRRESHIYNLSSLWGPWDGLSLTAGVQNEWTHEDGFGRGLAQVLAPDQPAFQHLYSSQRDKAILQEDAGLRYTRLPFTVLFADARFRQEWIDHYERDENSLDAQDFLRDTNARNDLKDVRTGFTVSPWPVVSLSADYRRSWEQTDYDHDRDTTPNPVVPAVGFIPGNGYPAFIRRRDLDSDEVEARLVLHPLRWLKTTLKYQRVTTDYRTVTDPSTLLGAGTVLPGGAIDAGRYDANIYSLNTTLARWRRLNLSTTLSYSDTRTITGVNGRAGVAPYEGDIWSVLSSANFIVNQSTDAQVSYSFSRADYRQSKGGDVLPLGIVYDRHGVIAGLTRRFGKRMSASLQYGFFSYSEPTSGGARDYVAHAVFASWKVVFE